MATKKQENPMCPRLSTEQKQENPMCPRLSTEQKLELKSLQLAEANLQNGINEAEKKLAQIRNAFFSRCNQIALELKADITKVEFNKDELKFQLRPGVKGKR